MIGKTKFSLGTFEQLSHKDFIVTDNNGNRVYWGDNPIAAMVWIQGMYETAVTKLLLPKILAEGYDRLGRKVGAGNNDG